jgi:hypothetical protein
MESVYHMVAIRVNETSWAHVWRLRFRYLRMGYDRNQPTTPLVVFIGPTKRLKCLYRLKKKLQLRKGILVRLALRRTWCHRTECLLLHFHVISMMMPRAAPVIAPSSVFRQNWETLEWLASRRSKQLDLDACPTPSSSSAHRFWGANRQTIAHLVLWPKPRNCRSDFVGQITKPHLLVLRPNPGNLSTLVFRLNQETYAPYLLVHGVCHTQHHPTSRSSGHRVPDLCLILMFRM